MATDNVEICNSALSIIGTRKIVALSDPSPEGRECNANYDSCRKAVLRDFPWNFATLRAVLSTIDGTAPAFGFTNRFALPTGFLRVHTVFDQSGCAMDPGTYRVESGFILTDEDVLWLKYVCDFSTTTAFDPLFDEALAAKIAAKIAYKITSSDAVAKRCEGFYLDALRKAKFTDSVEDSTEQIDGDVWIRARQGRGDFVRDPMT